MDFVVLALFSVAAVYYIWTVRAIWQMVNESKWLDSGVRFNLFWWTPAWKVHRTAYPESLLRKQIVTRGLLTCSFGVLAFGCKVYAVIDSSGWPR